MNTEPSAFEIYNRAHEHMISVFEAFIADPSKLSEAAMEEMLAAQAARRDAEVSLIASDEVVITGATKAELIALIRGDDIGAAPNASR
ncbi:MAG: hypothetical protein M9939_00740 [Mesorhizobium sp.]|nr:hypothetical protein [Mesorhizobium sp.]MCO5159634.1 hypothetical protein [Mesorhizobium sp.]